MGCKIFKIFILYYKSWNINIFLDLFLPCQHDWLAHYFLETHLRGHCLLLTVQLHSPYLFMIIFRFLFKMMNFEVWPWHRRCSYLLFCFVWSGVCMDEQVDLISTHITTMTSVVFLWQNFAIWRNFISNFFG